MSRKFLIENHRRWDELIFLRLIGHCGCPRFARGGWDAVEGEGVEDVESKLIDVGSGVDVAGDEEGAGHGMR